MKEGFLDVELMDHQVPGEGEGENGSNGGKLDDGVEGLVVVHSRALGEAPEDPTGLVAVKGPSEVSLWRKSHLSVTMLVTGGHNTRS
jgi:hypothetical protein